MEGISDDEVFLVDSILAQRKRKGVVEYLVSWKGAAEDTWEPAKTLAVDCAQAVQSFLQSQKTQKARPKSKSRSKSRSRSSSRSRKATQTRKSSRSRSRGRTSKSSSTTTSPVQEKVEETTVRRSVRQLKAAVAPSPDAKEEKKEEEVRVIETKVVTQQSSVSVTSSNSSMMEKSEEVPRRSLRSSTLEQREKLEVQRVHNDQRPTRDDDTKPRSPIWRVADYIVIVLFIISLCAALFLFLEKFVDLENFKKQAFPNFGVLKDRLAGAQVRVVELGHTVGDYISEAWLKVVDFITLPKTAGDSQAKAVPK